MIFKICIIVRDDVDFIPGLREVLLVGVEQERVVFNDAQVHGFVGLIQSVCSGRWRFRSVKKFGRHLGRFGSGGDGEMGADGEHRALADLRMHDALALDFFDNPIDDRQTQSKAVIVRPGVV